MFGFTIKDILVASAAVVLSALVWSAYDNLIDDPLVAHKATVEEGAKWQAAMDRLQIQADQEKADKDAAIADIERQRLLERAGSSLAQQKLQETIDALESEPAPTDPSCPPALDERLSTGLDAIR